ncbi:MAG TPA: hypothetical protein VFU73_07490 [Actinocrinis sp.]|nr:hypothetical protein [Actinocrinis sp.]
MADQDFSEELEAPEADADEQAQALDARDAEAVEEPSAQLGRIPWEADPADAAEQAVPVPVDEDEYR